MLSHISIQTNDQCAPHTCGKRVCWQITYRCEKYAYKGETVDKSGGPWFFSCFIHNPCRYGVWITQVCREAFFKPQNFQTPRESLNHDFLKLSKPEKVQSKSKCDKSNSPQFPVLLVCITLMAGAIITSSFLTSSGIIVLCEKYGNGIKYYQDTLVYLPDRVFCNPCFPVLLSLLPCSEIWN